VEDKKSDEEMYLQLLLHVLVEAALVGEGASELLRQHMAWSLLGAEDVGIVALHFCN